MACIYSEAWEFFQGVQGRGEERLRLGGAFSNVRKIGPNNPWIIVKSRVPGGRSVGINTALDVKNVVGGVGVSPNRIAPYHRGFRLQLHLFEVLFPILCCCVQLLCRSYLRGL